MIFNNPVRGTIHGTSWVRPSGNTDFRMTQDFGPSSLSGEPTVRWPGGDGIPAGTYYNFHRGIDLGNKRCGSDVIAARSGTVDFAGVDGTGNRVVIIDHGSGWRTWYGHLASRSVSKGQRVVTGQKIGAVGDSGYSTACHLHFATEKDHGDGGDFEFVDPWRRLKQNVRVRPKVVGTNIRTKPDLSSGSVYRAATSSDTTTNRKWGGQVTGASYTIDGKTSNKWEKIYLDGSYKYIATLLAWVSQR